MLLTGPDDLPSRGHQPDGSGNRKSATVSEGPQPISSTFPNPSGPRW